PVFSNVPLFLNVPSAPLPWLILPPAPVENFPLLVIAAPSWVLTSAPSHEVVPERFSLAPPLRLLAPPAPMAAPLALRVVPSMSPPLQSSDPNVAEFAPST